MATTVQPVIITADLNRLLAFYSGLFGATQTFRVPDDGPAFFVGLRVGDSEMGLVANAEGAAGAASRTSADASTGPSGEAPAPSQRSVATACPTTWVKSITPASVEATKLT